MHQGWMSRFLVRRNSLRIFFFTYISLLKVLALIHCSGEKKKVNFFFFIYLKNYRFEITWGWALQVALYKEGWFENNTETQDREDVQGAGTNLPLECDQRRVWREEVNRCCLWLTHTGFQAGPNQTREKQQKHDHRPGILLHTNTSTGLVWGCFYDHCNTNVSTPLQELDEI